MKFLWRCLKQSPGPPLRVTHKSNRNSFVSRLQATAEVVRAPITRIVEAEVVALVVPTVVLAEVPRFVMKVM